VAVLFCLLITRNHPLRKRRKLSDPLTPPQLVSNLARKYTGSTIFTACIVYNAIVCWHFHWKNIWEPQRDCVI